MEQVSWSPGWSYHSEMVELKHSKHFGCWYTSQDLAAKDVWVYKHVSGPAKPLLKLCGVSSGARPVNVLFFGVYLMGEEDLIGLVQDNSNNV